LAYNFGGKKSKIRLPHLLGFHYLLPWLFHSMEKKQKSVKKKKKTWVIRKEFKDRHREDLNKSRFINLKTK
jgi:hypothetical protein